MTKPITIHIVTHADCLDGIVAAWVVQNFYRQSTAYEIFIEYQTYNRPLPEFPEGANVVMVDFCPNDVEELKVLFTQVATLKILDHHPKSEAVFQEMKRWVMETGRMSDFDCEFSRHKSGALMAWHYFQEGPPPALIEYVSDSDLYQFNLPGSKEICAALEMFGMSIPAFEDRLKETIPSLIEMGTVVRNMHRQQIDWTIQQTRCVLYANQLVDGQNKDVYLLAVNGNAFIKNEVCARLEQCYPGFAGYVCYWDLTDGMERRYCVRSKNGNAQAIAVCYGGQGHECAAGFVLPRDNGTSYSRLELGVAIATDGPLDCPPC
jgi:hypothetical protein